MNEQVDRCSIDGCNNAADYIALVYRLPEWEPTDTVVCFCAYHGPPDE